MLDLIRDIENDLEGGWEAASRAELQNAEQTRRAVARVARAFWITVAILLVFNSARLETWVNGFEVGPVQNAVVALSTTWHEQMSSAGFDDLSHDLREGMTVLQSVGWPQVKSRFDSERKRTSEGVRLLRGRLNDHQG